MYLLRFEYVNLIFKLYWFFKNRFEKGRYKLFIIVNCIKIFYLWIKIYVFYDVIVGNGI